MTREEDAKSLQEAINSAGFAKIAVVPAITKDRYLWIDFSFSKEPKGALYSLLNLMGYKLYSPHPEMSPKYGEWVHR